MALPTLTPEQRNAALAKAAAARTARSELLRALKAGETTLADVLAKADADDEIVKKTKVLAVLKALPGIGDVRARQLIDGAEIAESRRVGGLGQRQREALLAAIS
ncbi:integration host factor, actinobacterial type [Amycolatopsis sp. cg9]|uniref:integration host factor, actinobacterial type n=1 Tax=Amycolatopsis sp. cg9 TaxID=3238801 RepID=UPI003526A362